MNVVVRHQLMTIENFLAWVARQEEKYEFNGYEPVAMTGGSSEHVRLERNLAVAVDTRLRDGRYEFLGSNMKLVTGSRVRYPDGQVVNASMNKGAMFSTMPVIVFEILSPSTERVDQEDKLEEYASIVSVQRYVLLRQDAAEAVVHSRGANSWNRVVIGAGGSIDMPEIGIAVPMSELYRASLEA